MTGLGKARERFASDWHDLRQSLRRETGKESRAAGNLSWPILGLGVGVALGAAYRWRRRARKG